jgi:methionine sulfoxide reductase heme-binding subunit
MSDDMPMRLIRKLLLWSLLAAPLAVLTYDYLYEGTILFGEVYYGGYIHDTGRAAAWLLLAALAATPLKLTFPRSRVAGWLLAQRRYFGVASFAYAAAHLAAYLARQDWPRVAEDMVQAGFWTGWIAFALFLPLALTSNDLSMRLLRRGWKNLHRLVHVAAVLVFAHWALTAFDPFLGYCHIAALALLEAYRLFLTWRPRRSSPAPYLRGFP